jgi:hypothetical protein
MQMALVQYVARPAQLLADACMRRAISLLHAASRTCSLAEHLATVAAGAAAAGLRVICCSLLQHAGKAHRIQGLIRSLLHCDCCMQVMSQHTIPGSQAQCVELQELKSMLSTLPTELPAAPDNVPFSCSRCHMPISTLSFSVHRMM